MSINSGRSLAEQGRTPGRGYLAPCRACGLVVVHAEKTGQPFHMHRWSKKCRDLAAKRRGTT